MGQMQIAAQPSDVAKHLDEIRNGTRDGFVSTEGDPQGTDPDLACPCCGGSGHKDDVAPISGESLQAQISEIGNQIHNLSCEYQNNEALLQRLCDLRGKLWDVAKLRTKPVDAAAVREPILTEAIVKQAMHEAWNDICYDTGCHPLDIQRVKRGELLFSPNHWASSTYERLRALSSEPAQGEKWQPIETAPKDGTVIQAWHKVHKCSVSVLWKDDGFPYQGERLNWYERSYTTAWPERAFTHWMPLPAAPTSEAGR